MNKIKFFMTSLVIAGMSMNVALASGKHGGGHNDKQGSPVGVPASAAKATKTIQVTTTDNMRYQFSSDLDLKAGEIVKFVVTNKGKISHEFSVGDKKEQKSHQAMMAKMPNMVHQDGNTVTVKPGETKELTWQFTGNAKVVFACNIPGHFEAGMFAKAKVAAARHH